MITNEMLEVHLQPIQEKHIRISLLQNFFVNEDDNLVRRFRKVGELQGNTTGGSIDINNNSTIRRTCSIDMVITDSSFLVSEDSKIWMDKWFKVELGIRNLKTDNIVWFNKGIFAINNPSIKYNSSTKSLHIEGLDLMCTLDGTLGGELGIVTKIQTNVDIPGVLETAVWRLGKISKTHIYIEQNASTLPYDIEKTPTDTVYSILEEIRDLYMDWEIFFDEEGRFIYQKIKNRYVDNPLPNYENDVITFNFLEEHDLVNDYGLDYDFQNVKNKIIIWGHQLDNGIQIHHELINSNPDSPFDINKLGEIPKTIIDDKIFTDEQAEQRARYEFWKHNNFCEQVNIQMLPVYFLDVNKLVEFNKPEINLVGKYLVDSIHLPLEIDSLMSLRAHRVYATIREE
ncbi:hypothetical protein DW1_1161 [Proteiniborus sp. DW1]|uniref:DUF5048 domain-containing protein n=1 Tax=Proteiniborus sp. DW1 TaxID=1889883 RepID=UPI00092E035A|nr:DUF5048 domain-containing protein [Proteiniborus sp. DW1]SCG82734.1 hypothetical protein DW1_1161 [Proteiniborus sp. DW1]